MTKIELTGTEKLFTLLMKLFVSFMYEGICFITGWRWWSTNLEISDVWHSIEFIIGLPGLFGLWIFGMFFAIFQYLYCWCMKIFSHKKGEFLIKMFSSKFLLIWVQTEFLKKLFQIKFFKPCSEPMQLYYQFNNNFSWPKIYKYLYLLPLCVKWAANIFNFRPVAGGEGGGNMQPNPDFC